MEKLQNLIDGELRPAVSQKWLDNYNPSTGEVYSLIPDSGTEDIALAVKSAQKAFPAWSKTSINHRSRILTRIADEIEAQMDEFVAAESKDNGKPLSLAKAVDIPRAVSNFRFYAQAITQFSSDSQENTASKTINYTLRRPVGIVGCISPWNLPLYLFSWKIAPALAAGNCVIAKPSEVTPMTAFLLSKICQKIDLPKGVLNVVHGLGEAAGQAIVEHPEIKAISFTGGTTTGAAISKIAAPQFKKLSLELGGKNPNLIFADCNYDKMLKTTIHSSFANQGQICLCGSRIFVENKIYERFKKDFIAATKKLKVGAPTDPKSNLGALVSKPHFEKVLGYIRGINNEEATILTGGNPVTVPGRENGYYLEPTIIEVKTNDCKLNQEEIFGPVVTIMPFEEEAAAVKMANDVRYGLSSTLWTSDVNRIMRVSGQLETGIVWVNTWLNRDLRTPFGGIKESGVGREGGFHALEFFTEPKNVCIQYE
ncbi:MAG TPA: aldehyde dehydrogenase [Flavobacteriaceae bacterium]|nr:aldehyde dehydrogenase [Flavobacteriaceae bacterium]